MLFVFLVPSKATLVLYSGSLNTAIEGINVGPGHSCTRLHILDVDESIDRLFHSKDIVNL